jgi:hypothetical protein
MTDDTTGQKRRGPQNMTQEHKDALEQGRQESRAVRAYLEALRGHKPKRGRPRDTDKMRARLDAIQGELGGADPIQELRLIQERINLGMALATTVDTVDMDALEKAFVAVAGSYSARQGISYAAWREVGVPANVLKEAGIARTRTDPE